MNVVESQMTKIFIHLGLSIVCKDNYGWLNYWATSNHVSQAYPAHGVLCTVCAR